MLGVIVVILIMLVLGVYFFLLVRAITSRSKNKVKATVIFGSILLTLTIVVLFALAGNVFAEETHASSQTSHDTQPVQAKEDPLALGLKYIASALAVGIAAVGAGIAVGPIGVSAISVIAEKPEMFGISLIFVGLAEGIAIYGIAIAILIMFVI
ncbi:MAG: ATP synthase subunit C [Brevinematia bacterium]